jgi:hypothetical protein
MVQRRPTSRPTAGCVFATPQGSAGRLRESGKRWISLPRRLGSALSYTTSADTNAGPPSTSGKPRQLVRVPVLRSSGGPRLPVAAYFCELSEKQSGVAQPEVLAHVDECGLRVAAVAQMIALIAMVLTSPRRSHVFIVKRLCDRREVIGGKST